MVSFRISNFDIQIVGRNSGPLNIMAADACLGPTKRRHLAGGWNADGFQLAMRWLLLLVTIYVSVLPVLATNVAICFFGLTRSLDLTISNIRSSVLDPLLMAEMNVSVYLHTYDLEAISNPRSAESQAPFDWTTYKLLQPKKLQIDSADAAERRLLKPNLEVWLKHGDAWGEETDEHTTLRNFLKQLYSLRQVTKLWLADKEHLDLIFYLRMDIWFFNTLQISEIQQAILQPRTLYTPAFHKWDGLNDRLAFGVPSVMEVYGNRLQHALNFSATQALHAEKFLLHVIKQAGLNHLGETSLLFERVRATGELWGIPSNDSIHGDDSSTFHLRPGLKIQKGVYGTLDIVPL